MEKRTTKISRSWGATIGYLIGAIVAFAISIALFMSVVEGPMTFGIALIPAIVALILLFMSFGGAGQTTCPICDAQLGGLSTKSNDGVLCASCHRYSEGKDDFALADGRKSNRRRTHIHFTTPCAVHSSGRMLRMRQAGGDSRKDYSPNSECLFSRHGCDCRRNYQHDSLGRGAALCRA